MAALPAPGHANPSSPAGQREPGLLIPAAVKPWSEGAPATTVAACWIRQHAPQAAAALEGDQYQEFVTARSEKPGQDALAKPRDAVRLDVAAWLPRRGGNLTKLTLRPVQLPAGARMSLELMGGASTDSPGPPPSGGAAVLLPGIQLLPFAAASPTKG